MQVPAGAVRGQWVPKNSSQGEKENSIRLVYTPEAAARVPKDKTQSKGKKVNDGAIYDHVQTRHCFNFSTFDGPTDPVVPEVRSTSFYIRWWQTVAVSLTTLISVSVSALF